MVAPSQKYSVGMVFGVFDGLHEGHHHFLTEAQRHCTRLIVVVAHPNIVRSLKQRLPLFSLTKRIETLRALSTSYEVIVGDTGIGTWSALKHFQPDIVLLGYDQERLGQELAKLDVPHTFLSSHYPEKFKSSLLNNQRAA